MPSGQRLENKVAIVTGAGTRGEIAGTGQAASILMAREGAKVLLSDIDIDRAEETLNTIEKEGGTAKIFIGDVTSEKDCEAMVNESVKQFGKLDILFNNVGGPGGGMVTEIEEEDWHRSIDLNMKSAVMGSKYAIPTMEKSGGGSIINLSSIIGLVGYPTGLNAGAFNPYPPSKGAVIQLTKNMAVELASHKIRVNCICPGFLKTNLTKAYWTNNEKLKFLEDRHPMGRLGDPIEVAYTCLYLASDESSYVTGIALPVDGGYTAQ